MEFANALSAALQARSLSLSDAHRCLEKRGVSVSVATLSYWRSGARYPDPVRSAAVLSALEEILDVSPGTLAGRIPAQSRRLGTLGRVARPEGTDVRRARMLEKLDVTPHENFRVLSLQETIDVDSRLAITSVQTNLLVQCVQGTLGSLGFVDLISEQTTLRPQFVVNAGGQFDGAHADDGMVFGHRVVLDKTIHPGETAMIDIDVSFPSGFPEQRCHALVVWRRTRELLQWFRFTDGHLPDWFEEEEAQQPLRTVPLAEPRSVHRARSDFGPSWLLARWGHIDDE